jgi:hypothetical protein
MKAGKILGRKWRRKKKRAKGEPAENSPSFFGAA